jgi:hypothetical protein
MTDKDFSQLKKIIEEILKIEENNILSKSMEIPVKYHKILGIYVKELDSLENLKSKLEKKYGELYKQYKYNDNYNWERKNEIESQIYSNSEYNKLKLEINRQEIITEYLSKSLNNLNNMSFHIKNYIDMRKYLNGE